MGIIMLRHIFGMVLLCTAFSSFAVTPKHGWLTTKKNLILNERGNIVQLKGMSFFWSTPTWYNGSGSIGTFYSATMVKTLVNDWNCTVLRAAYDRDQGHNNGWSYVQTVIDAAIAEGIYVIIDWHAHDALDYQSQAVTFFTEQATKYKNTPNVIFEPFNEPVTEGDAVANDGNPENARKTWTALKPYYEAIVKAIRGTGAKNLIICGTPYYCQHIGVAAGSPLKDASGNLSENVAYSFHFYAASHGMYAYYVKDEGGGMEATYLDAGINTIPVFVTEWGTTHRDGGEGGDHPYIDKTNTDWWFKNYIDKYHLSHCNWSVSDFQASSCFSGGTTASESGTIVKGHLAGTTDEFPPENITGFEGPAKDTVHNVPSPYIAASRFNRFYGAHAETASVAFGSRDNVDRRIPGTAGYTTLKITPGADENWASFFLSSKRASSKIALRCLTKDGAGTIEFDVNGTRAAQLTLTTEAAWKTAGTTLNLTPGADTLKLNFVNTTGTGYLIEWIEFPDSTGISTYLHHAGILQPSVTITANRLIISSAQSYSGWSMFSTNGRLVRSGILHPLTTIIRFDNFPTGMHLLRLSGPGRADAFSIPVNQRPLSPSDRHY